MNQNDHKLPDDIFQEGLEGFEAPYSDAAWEDMRSLLDKADRKRPFVLWFQKNKNTTLTLISITMIATTLISIFAVLQSNSGQWITRNSATQNVAKEEMYTPERSEPTAENARTSEYSVKPNTAYNNANPAKYQATHAAPIQNRNLQYETAADNAYPKGSDSATANKTPVVVDIKTPTAGTDETDKPSTCDGDKPANPVDLKTPVKVIGKLKVAGAQGNGELQKNPLRNYPADYTTFRGPWMGIHFTLQNPELPILMDSNRQNAGFNWQFMSNNLIPRTDFGAYLGFDFGMQFYGHGKNYGVVLNNTELDSGFTRLNTTSFDFFVRGHFEYAKFRLKPYVNGFIGPRLYSTNQYTEAYHHKQDYDNSSSNSVATSGSLMYGGALGARYAISKHVSLDLRYELMQGTETRLVDLDQSAFSGISTFNLNKFKVAPAYSQWKFGVLFDLWDGNTEKEYEPLNNNEVTEVTEYYTYDSVSNQYIRVNCKCKQTPVNADSTEIQSTAGKRPVPFDEPDTQNNPKPKSSWTPSGSGRSGGGGGRGSFPGIKPGGGTPIRN